jgi:hypothetical protein
MKFRSRSTGRTGVVNIALQPLPKLDQEVDGARTLRVAVSDIDQVKPDVGTNKLDVIELHDQGRQIGQKRLGDAPGRLGKARKPGSAGRITKPLGKVSKDRLERVGLVSHDPAQP